MAAFPFTEVLTRLTPKLVPGETVLDHLECHKGFFDGYLVLTSQRLIFCEYTPIFGLKTQEKPLAEIKDAVYRKLPMDEFITFGHDVSELKFGRFKSDEAQAFAARAQHIIEGLRGKPAGPAETPTPAPVKSKPHFDFPDRVEVPEAREVRDAFQTSAPLTVSQPRAVEVPTREELLQQIATTLPQEVEVPASDESPKKLAVNLPHEVEVPAERDSGAFGTVLQPKGGPSLGTQYAAAHPSSAHVPPSTAHAAGRSYPTEPVNVGRVAYLKAKKSLWGPLVVLLIWLFFGHSVLRGTGADTDPVWLTVLFALAFWVFWRIKARSTADAGRITVQAEATQGVAPGRLLKLSLNATTRNNLLMPKFGMVLHVNSRKPGDKGWTYFIGPRLDLGFPGLPAVVTRQKPLETYTQLPLPFPLRPPDEGEWELESYELVFTATEPTFTMERIYLPVPPL